MVTLERSAASPRRAAGLEGLLGGVLERLEARPSGLDAEGRDLVVRAGHLADEVHRGQVRRSGEPYVTHPLAVAGIVAHLGLDPRSVAAAILHDAVEDTGLGLEEVEKRFGPEVSAIVDGVTKLDRLQFDSKEAQQAATVRKMLIAMASDWRVLVIKLADRLHNMRTIAVMPEWKQRRTAQETLDIYAPLAHRLGIQELKWQLEDLAFATLHPEAVRGDRADGRGARPRTRPVPGAGARSSARPARRIRCRRRGHRPAEAPLEHLREDGGEGQGVRRHLRPGGDPRRGRLGEGLLGGARIDTRDLEPGSGTLQGLHKQPEVQPLPIPPHDRGRSGGQTDRGADTHPGDAPQGRVRHCRPLGVQGSSDRRRCGRVDGDGLAPADRGLAGRHRRPVRVPGDPEAGSGPGRGLRVHAEREGDRPPGAFDSCRLRVRDPHRGRPPLHRRQGERQARPARHPAVSSADTVEIITSKVPSAGPSRDWLQIVASPRARNKIRQWFSRERREDAIENGREELTKALRREGLPTQKQVTAGALERLAATMSYIDTDALFAAVGEGHISARSIAQRVARELRGGDNEEQLPTTVRPNSSDTRTRRDARVGVYVEGLDDVMVRLSRCCTPVAGDEIVGFVTRGRGVSVHRADCANALALATGERERLIEVEWDRGGTSSFLASIEVMAFDRASLLADVTRAVSEHHLNIVSSSSQTTPDRVSRMRFDVELADLAHLESLLGSLKRLDSVFDAYRSLPGRRA